VIAYRAMLDVPGELVAKIAFCCAASAAAAVPAATRALNCWKQALLGLVWVGKNDEMAALAAGFGISRGHRLPLPRVTETPEQIAWLLNQFGARWRTRRSAAVHRRRSA
jgi:hypothetical protein